MNYPLLAASVLTLAVFFIHLLVGGRESAKPLLAGGGLADVARYSLYYAWHLVSFVLLMMAAGFGAAALDPGHAAFGFAGLVAAIGFAVISLAMTLRFRLPLTLLPQWGLFVPIAALALWGLETG